MKMNRKTLCSPLILAIVLYLAMFAAAMLLFARLSAELVIMAYADEPETVVETAEIIETTETTKVTTPAPYIVLDSDSAAGKMKGDYIMMSGGDVYIACSNRPENSSVVILKLGADYPNREDWELESHPCSESSTTITGLPEGVSWFTPEPGQYYQVQLLSDGVSICSNVIVCVPSENRA